MIQPVTLPAAAKLILAIDSPVANGDGAGFDAQLSELLAANLGASPAPVAANAANAAKPEVPEAALKPQLRPATGKHSGKLPGKILPDSPALAAFASLWQKMRGKDDAGDAAMPAKAGEAEPAASEIAADPAAPAIAVPGIVIPAVAVPVAANDPVAANVIVPELAQSGTANVRSAGAETRLAQPAAAGINLPQAIAAAPVQPETASPASPTSQSPPAKPEIARLVIQNGLTTRMVLAPRNQPDSGDPNRGEMALFQSMVVEPAKQGEIAAQVAVTALRQAPEDRTTRLTALRQPDSSAVAIVELRQSPDVLPAGQTDVRQPVSAEVAVAELGQASLDRSARLSATGQPDGAAVSVAEHRPAPEDRIARLAPARQPDSAAVTVTGPRQAPEDRAGRTAPLRLPDSTAVAAADPAPQQARPIAASDADRPLEARRGAFARLDASSPISVDPGALPTAPPVIEASPVQPRTPDFAALIDRLVEARQAAQTTLETHTVNAAVQHAEFGQVSLQFRHDAAGLSVVMASADPDLARAMQVAAPGGQFASQSGGEGNAPPQRQDTPGQSSSGQQSSGPLSSSSGQAQAQAQQQRGQVPQRAADQASASANPSPRSRDQANQGARSGIFA